MTFQFIPGTFNSLFTTWKNLQEADPNRQPFSSPEWSHTWWQHFGHGNELFLGSIEENQESIGIAPLMLHGKTAFLIGSVDVCDYLDFVIAPGKEDQFFRVLIDRLATAGITRLDLAPLRPESAVLKYLPGIATGKGLLFDRENEDITVLLDLPSAWDDYLNLLERHQRFELKRKFRRLEEAGDLNYRNNTVWNSADVETFFKLFKESRQDKAAFLTAEREAFFRTLIQKMADAGFLRLNFLEINNLTIAATLCFDYNNTIYLYNSGYNPEYSWLSAGLLSKAKCIQESISRGKKKFDFLKGDEKYKYHLGGQELPLYKCSLSFPGDNYGKPGNLK
jgi:CelD/BcsL family acetyltransferase involved in cellulose biosynthesis